ncbi:GNAT family N-acetyltransferase [Oscillibacter valericigenes]|uniref:GNAT family N-acetyltransferase n=1 Tax=Oscillibacter valericigenes TaxID=351091 RepID=UPI001F46036D|nr:GNAT family N-acetyltransferase [Oscillibacter valericigenes]MCF2664956.1 GNAT family N-acetyltransferase [Oscillibacter valericigenes]
MALEYKRATLADLDILVETRAEVLRAANRLDASADMTQVERETRAYYRSALADSTHTAYLVFDGDLFVGAGGVSYYSVMPTYHNPTGQKAYIMNMYTRPAYRRQGIARRTLDLLVRDAESRGVRAISLEATEMGRPLYEAYGFVPMTSEMELPEA